MENINPTFISFLIVCVLGLSGFVVWLVKKIIHLTEKNTDAMTKLFSAVDNNTEAVKELREIILTKI